MGRVAAFRLGRFAPSLNDRGSHRSLSERSETKRLHEKEL